MYLGTNVLNGILKVFIFFSLITSYKYFENTNIYWISFHILLLQLNGLNNKTRSAVHKSTHDELGLKVIEWCFANDRYPSLYTKHKSEYRKTQTVRV